METTLIRPAMAEPASQERAGIGALAEDFDRVVRDYQRPIYRVLFALLRDQDAANTLTQECFLRAWKQRSGFRGEASLGTWLRRIAVNLAIDHQRNRRASFWKRLFAAPPGADEEAGGDAVDRIAALPGDLASPERALLAREQAARVWQIAGALPLQQRTIFLLRFAEELSLEEIAQTMGIQVGTVKAHLFRAVHAVRAEWKK